MTTIKMDRFGGSTHKNAPHLIAPPYASYALNCKFDRGMLSSFRDVQPIVEDDSMRLEYGEKWIQVGCCWIKVPLCTDFTDGPLQCSTYYFTGRNSYPEEGILDPVTCEIEWYRLGLPCPPSAPSVEWEDEDCTPTDCQDGCLDKDAEARVYVYQYVNSRGQRSAVSPPSDVKIVNDGTQAIVSGWSKPDSSWDVASVRIYRSVSGYSPNENKANNTFDTQYMFVGEVPITQQYFVDNLINYELRDALEEDHLLMPPPANLRGIHRINNMNVLVGFAGNSLYFTRNNKWHDWSIEIALDDNIRAIAVSGDMVYVATDGVPYVVVGVADCDQAECRQVMKHTTHYPYIGCDNNGMIEVSGGAVYPTHEGLVYLRKEAEPSLITSGLYSTEQWQQLQPDTVKPVFYKGTLFLFFRTYACALVLSGEHNLHTSLSDTGVVYAFVARTGEMYLEKYDNTYLWGRANYKRPHKWRSPELHTGRRIGFAAISVTTEQGAEFVKIEMDNRVIIERDVRPSYPMALPLWATGEKHYIELSGVADVSFVSLATSVEEL